MNSDLGASENVAICFFFPLRLKKLLKSFVKLIERPPKPKVLKMLSRMKTPQNSFIILGILRLNCSTTSKQWEEEVPSACRPSLKLDLQLFEQMFWYLLDKT